MAGFNFRYRLSGGSPTLQDLTFKDTETLTKGDLGNLESGEVDLAVTADTALVGVALATKAGTDSTDVLQFVTDQDAVYGVEDANARAIGDTLDISGATGAQTVAPSTNADLIVVADSGADEETLVRINTGSSWLD